MTKSYFHATFSLFMALLLIFPLSLGAYAANTGQFDLDVMFVIDNSGSMKNSDPNHLALSAANLFVDMCEDSDTRIGYVLFTDRIVSEQRLAGIESYSEKLKSTIASIQYPQLGSTDIALGLERAYELLEEDVLNGQSGRKPVVILLSDGNTDLVPESQRTIPESLAALENVKEKFAMANVPVCTIGFNYDGMLDIGVMEAIADNTKGIAQETRTADKLPSILRNIYGHLTNSTTITMTTQATGEPQDVPIMIDNDSIYKATITISSNNRMVEEVKIIAPDGTVHDESSKNSSVTMNEDLNGKYILITLYNPMKGEWILNFRGTKDDTISIDLLSVYDLKLVMDPPNGLVNQAEISWHLEDGLGGKVVDEGLLSGISVILHADGKEYPFSAPGNNSETIDIEAGEYKDAYLTMSSKDIRGNKMSNTQDFTVYAKKPIELVNSAVDTKKITLVTLFKTKDDFILSELLEYSNDNKPLVIDLDRNSANWNEYFEVEYEDSNEAFNIIALKSGDAEAEIAVYDNDKAEVIIYISTHIISGWLFIIIFAVALLVVAIVVILAMLNRKPFLDTPMLDFSIQVDLPENELEYTPSQTKMRLEHVKAKRTLKEIIDFNKENSSAYNSALQKISWFASGTVFYAKRKDRQAYLEISVPVNQNFNVLVDNKKQSKTFTGQLSKQRPLKIELARIGDEDAYTITFNYDAVGVDSVQFEDDTGAPSYVGGSDDGFDF